jgi:hypothetical protein
MKNIKTNSFKAAEDKQSYEKPSRDKIKHLVRNGSEENTGINKQRKEKKKTIIEPIKRSLGCSCENNITKEAQEQRGIINFGDVFLGILDGYEQSGKIDYEGAYSAREILTEAVGIASDYKYVMIGENGYSTEQVENVGAGEVQQPQQPQEAIMASKKKIAQIENNPLNGKSNQQARNIINNKILPDTSGFFSDDYWEGPGRIWKAFNAAGLDWGTVKTEYQKDERDNPVRKVWVVEIDFINNKNKETKLYGTVVAAGAGTVEDPLSRYDITAYVA